MIRTNTSIEGATSNQIKKGRNYNKHLYIYIYNYQLIHFLKVYIIGELLVNGCILKLCRYNMLQVSDFVWSNTPYPRNRVKFHFMCITRRSHIFGPNSPYDISVSRQNLYFRPHIFGKNIFCAGQIWILEVIYFHYFIFFS